MLTYPTTVRKGLITEPSSAVYHPDTVHILQDDHFLPDLPHDACFQPQLQSPFQYTPDVHFVSPPSSAPPSPNFSFSSSPASSPPNPVATDYSTAGDNSNNSSIYEAPSMTPSSSYNPSIQIQQSTSPPASQPYLAPSSHYYQQPYFFDDASMLAQQQPVTNNHGWDSNLQLLSPAHVSANGLPRVPSPNTKNAHRKSSSSSAPISKPLPTPVQTPIQNSFLAAPFQSYDPSSQNGNSDAEIAMRHAMLEQQQQQQQQQQQRSHQHQRSDHSLAPSVSTVSHNSPVTPQTSYDDLDDASKVMANGEDLSLGVDTWMNEYLQPDPRSEYNNNFNNNGSTMGIPKLNRTISDIYQDELYNTAIMPASQVSKKPSSNQQMLNPYRNVFADRLQAANQGHLSARQSINRERSPFRQNSPLAVEFTNAALQPSSQLNTSIPIPQNGVHMPQSTAPGEPKTMSPKDALLDFNEGEDAAMPPLFSNQSDFNLGDALGHLRRESSSSLRQPQNFNTMESYPSQYPTAGVPQQYPFAAPQAAPQHERRLSQPQPQQQNNMLQQTPEFPASLPSLESTGSEGLPSTEMSPPQAPPTVKGLSRPANTSSDSGTYTCTYHGCTLRFESPNKLQKHKREAHRQTTPGGHLLTRDVSARNSQAGPHKCERVNPSTGKPCNSVFSRPYDLTRHEDTIHNARKQKVRCHLCTEEKTFSRNDALTRHMRVVHPEVDWPGKQRRRGRE
ncbi:stress-regulated transcription factor RPN4 [Aspergillus glaucus CBS 516.65]|uniref:C2H2-type domain-containing protein n=1 Tax=Aspergillus glaucus CBS 516.65 TaxID=1160497 RepID=A0A1L9VAD7_ASPGL|nr:hypothetical protein ASPGLDRAFT_28511 [Aspergillus glaucus CBS 516.65]OJJ80863.1 hypothetical protein ASPGLDRAFT_28511 [Aspergillus glaucus CBS 516.65]